VTQTTTNERAGREAMIEMLSDEGATLARCLGGMIALVQMCGNPTERRLASAADVAITELLQQLRPH
jgi:hypothetical protein